MQEHASKYEGDIHTRLDKLLMYTHVLMYVMINSPVGLNVTFSFGVGVSVTMPARVIGDRGYRKWRSRCIVTVVYLQEMAEIEIQPFTVFGLQNAVV